MKSDVFFFVTTIVVACIGIVFIIAFAFFIRILSRLNRLTKDIEEKTHDILSDVWRFYETVKGVVGKAESFLTFFSEKKSSKKTKRRSNKKT